MSTPSFYTYLPTGYIPIEYPNGDNTVFPKAPKEKNEEPTKTSSGEEKEPRETLLERPQEIRTHSDDSFSKEYVSFNTYSLIDKIDQELSLWADLDTDEALAHISNIKDILEANSEYLIQEPETRILLSMLQLLFRNNNWENIDKKDILYLRNELKRFKEGNATWNELRKFSKQLYRKRMYLLKINIKNGKKKERTKN